VLIRRKKIIMETKYDVIVIGGGHAGCEAAYAASKLGCRTLLITLHLDTIGYMSCNPAVGGVGKGQLVKELDALGGIMGKLTDKTGIQFRLLNRSKGPAVQSTRVQVDRQLYRLRMKEFLEKCQNIHLWQDSVEKLIIEKERVVGVETKSGVKFYSTCTVVCPGTFLNGLIHIGLVHFPGGRLGELPSISLSENLKYLGFKMGRFKTGTCARVDGKTINFSALMKQESDTYPPLFSFYTNNIPPEISAGKRLPCYITYTNPKTHEIIRNNLDRSPLYTGVIKSTGVRYCPSIEDKVVKFPDRDRHQVFLEPEGINTNEYYLNGLSTSLPVDVQIEMLRSIEGLEKVEIIRPGYGIEHDYVEPTQLYPTLETKLIRNLFLAGQINGTTGYEEAAAQGLIAGVNAALRAKNNEQFVLDRTEAYIGVLIDDLVTKGTNEPYRMFTSRVEYRLLLREDNAHLRLTEKAYKLGLVDSSLYNEIASIKKLINELETALSTVKLSPTNEVNEILSSLNTAPINEPITLEMLLRRPEINIPTLAKFYPDILNYPEYVQKEVEINIKYKGYIQQELKEVERFKKYEHMPLPRDFDYSKLQGLSNEIKEKLNFFKPLTIGQAKRIPGMTAAAISVLMVYFSRKK
jgi:tRNA uridine 5-carboxymethylaminomethyl modification enzyme